MIVAVLLITACGPLTKASPHVAMTPSGPGAPPANPALHLPEGDLTVRGARGPALQLHVQIAETQAARETGLMSVKTMADTVGMVFLFGGTTTSAFWMKDTLLPLDIAFWDAKGTIVTAVTMQPCTSDPCLYYYASSPYLGAVEMAAGLLNRMGVQPGDNVTLTR
ncbi:MAG: DUF192 domain-containing protein [Actinomycetota bacterium]